MNVGIAHVMALGHARKARAQQYLVEAVIVEVSPALAAPHQLAEAVELPVAHLNLCRGEGVPLQLHFIVVPVYIHLVDTPASPFNLTPTPAYTSSTHPSHSTPAVDFLFVFL